MNLCTTCNQDFGSVTAFDTHRVGVHEYTYSEGLRMEPMREDGRRCLTIDEMATLTDKKGSPVFTKNARGAWSLTRTLASAQRVRLQPTGPT